MRRLLRAVVISAGLMSASMGSAFAALPQQDVAAAQALAQQIAVCVQGEADCLALLQQLKAVTAADPAIQARLVGAAVLNVTNQYSAANLTPPTAFVTFALENVAPAAGDGFGGGCEVSSSSASDGCFA
jgi:hypothetical protein